MKNFFKLSALAAVLVASATYASASTITLASAGSATGPYTNGTLEFLGYNATQGVIYPGSVTFNTTVNGAAFAATGATTNIGTGGGVWVGPLTGSSWVSFTNTAPGAGVSANGSYIYRTTFDTTSLGAGSYTGSLAILADDTVSVFLNGTAIGNEVETAQPVGADGHCSAGVPSCSDPAGTLVSLNGIVSGVNTLYFVVEQTGLSAEGLDFVGTVSTSPVPEPSSLLMLGTGLLGSAGALFRRMRK
jgi:hypothetical protein